MTRYTHGTIAWTELLAGDVDGLAVDDDSPAEVVPELAEHFAQTQGPVTGLFDGYP